ncbi:MAG: hypothetical protein A3K19_23325 [Lentisphaerae bacterium RIFOXYB12_FULL_65_16]|nr:MAG: hypothetical protein A3K18_20185 [Lentisphaerae bacterium RIFOXYA12_64_32]OGV87497.1 MAG: hypothetical protein A3K19_23325 [Lentisphaerae bacterium RIFOXYB12_FULL_65_16]
MTGRVSGRFVAVLWAFPVLAGFAAAPPPISVSAENLRPLPEVKVAVSVNLLPNPSFERGVPGILTEYWSRFGEVNRACVKSGSVDGGAFDGNRSARVAAGETLCIPTEHPGLPKEEFVLSAYVRLADGAPAATTQCRVGLWVKVDVDDGRPKPETWEKVVPVTAEWQRVVLPVKVDRVLDLNRWGIVGALFEARLGAEGGDVLVDAVQLEQNTDATAFAGECVALPGVAAVPPKLDELAVVMRALQAPPEGVPAEAAPGEMPLTVSLPRDASGGVFASGGVPFARGVLFRCEQVRLEDAEGRPVPLQTEVLARYAADGSIRSLYVVFPVMVSGAVAVPRFTLRFGGPAAPPVDAARVAVTEGAADVTVVTGPLKLVLSRGSFRLFDGVWFDADGNGEFSDGERVIDASQTGGCRALGDAGEDWDSRRDQPVLVVERAGPVEAVVRAQGWHRDAERRGRLGYIVRVNAYAGSSSLKIEHTFENLTPPAAPALGLSGVTFMLPVGPVADVVTGADTERLPVGGALRVLQTMRGDEVCGAITRDGITEWRDRELDGRFLFTAAHAAVGLRVADFAANAPLAIAVDPDGVSVELWPTREVKTLALSHGVGKTHRMWLGFAAPGGVPELPVGPVRVFPDPARALPTEAFVWGVPPAGSPYPAFEAALGHSFELQGAADEVIAARGKFNVGDCMSRGGFWLNNETAVPRAWFLQYLRTGDRRLFNTAERAVWHTMDVDMDRVTGGQYVHNIHHALGRTTHSSHNYAEILTLHYLLTGDALSLDCARRNAVLCREWVTKKWNTGRGHGWPAWHIAEMCDVTCEKINVDAALAIVKRFRESVKVENGVRTSLSGEGGLLYGGTNLNALLRIHRATGDADARAVFLDELDYTIEHVQAKGEWAFQGRTLMMVEPMVYGWRLTGDRKYVDQGLAALLAGAAASGGRDLDLAMGAPLVAAAAPLGMAEPSTLIAQPWGFKRQHAMFIQEDTDAPLKVEYKRLATGGRSSEWWLKLQAPDGQLVKDEKFAAMGDTAGSFELPADGKVGVWRLDVHQGYPAMVDFAFNVSKVVLQIDPAMWRFVYTPELYWFSVPPEAESFVIAVKQYFGDGPSALVIYGPDGETVQTQRWEPPEAGERPWLEVRIAVPPAARARVWSMLVAVGGQFQLRMDGIPPFVAGTRDAVFTPPMWNGAPGQ